MIDLFKEAEKRKIDYKRLHRVVVKKNYKDEEYDVVVIIPVRNRINFHKIVADHFREAIKCVPGKKIIICFSEHSSHPQHHSFSGDNESSIWIPALDNPFNKCLAHNTAASLYKKSKWYLFHDTDLLINPDFFINIFENIKDFDAIQSFTKRRVLHCSEIVTKEVFSGISTVKNMKGGFGGVDIAEPGAPGGSIFISSNFFYNIGGYDPEFFTEYSVEDQFFFDKMSLYGNIGFCDNPPNEVFHLWHPANRLTKEQDWSVFHAFHSLTKEKKISFIEHKAAIFKKNLFSI